jgi:hypothetical protein
MGVDYNAFLGIGKRFDNKEDVKEFLKKHAFLNDDHIAHVFDGGALDGVIAECLDCYSGEDWFVGFEVGGEHPDTLINNVVEVHERWDAMFKDVAPRVIHAVKIW